MDKETFKKKYIKNLTTARELQSKLKTNKDAEIKMKKKFAEDTFKGYHYGDKVLVKLLGTHKYVPAYVGDMDTIVYTASAKDPSDIEICGVRMELHEVNKDGSMNKVRKLGNIIYEHIELGAADLKHA